MSLGMWVAIALVGGVGAVLRFALDWLISLRFGFGFPFGILAVNLSGSFLFGLLVGAAIGGNARLLAGTALLGAYTTFSTWMLDTRALAQRGQAQEALLNIAISAMAGLGAAALGHAIGAQI